MKCLLLYCKDSDIIVKNTLPLFCILSYLLIAFSVKGQISPCHESDKTLPFSVHYYNTKQGLPQNQVMDIVEKKNGNIVVTTTNGIAMYNGVDFFHFITNNDYKKDIHYKLSRNSDMDKLYGWALNGNYNQIHPYFMRLAVYSCILFGDSIVTGVSPEGLVRMSSYDLKKTYHLVKTDIHGARAVINAHDYYFISDMEYLYKVDKKNGEKQVLLKGFFEILRINPYTGDLYVLDKNKAYRIKTSGEIHNVPLNSTLEGVVLRDIEFIDEKEFFITSSIGIYHLKKGDSHFYGVGEGILFPSLYAIHYYRTEKCILVGTENNGLMKLLPKTAKTYFMENSVGSQAFVSVIKGDDGGIYSAGAQGRIVRLENNRIKQNIFFNTHVASLSYIDEKIYVGVWLGGVLIFQNGEVIDQIKPEKLPSPHVHAIFQDSKGTIWLGTGNGVVRKSLSGKYETISLTNGHIISAYELRNGDICFGGTNGVFILSQKGKLVRYINEEQGLICREVRAFYEDEQEGLWIGTYGGGLFHYHNDNLISINNKPNCQLDQDIFTLVKTPEGLLYMASNQGVWSVSENKLNDFNDGKILYLIPAYYGEETGIINTEFNGGFHNNYLQTAGKIYFPSIHGLVELTPDSSFPFRKLQPHFKSITINDTLIPSSHVFKRSTHTVKFEFYCPTFVEQYNIHYQYKIEGEGHPDTWSRPQKQSSVSLRMLPPGDYVFSVRGIDCFNDPNPIVLSYSFTIKPFFYETILFKISLSVLLAVSIFLLVRFRMRKEVEKNKIANTILELKLNAIHAKMNPHFMFNVLNNIIYLLNVEKYDEAEQLLQDFSLLLRRFLEKNDSSFISIEEELDILKLYLTIQQRRYNYLFEYSIECPRELLKKQIPSMLIQPFVENSIIHGIAHSSNHSCVLSISLVQKEQYIEIRIEDNGIGRKKSHEINKSRTEHVSYGMKLVEEKISVMRQKHQVEIEFAIEDIETEERTGTVVILKISLNDKLSYS